MSKSKQIIVIDKEEDTSGTIMVDTIPVTEDEASGIEIDVGDALLNAPNGMVNHPKIEPRVEPIVPKTRRKTILALLFLLPLMVATAVVWTIHGRRRRSGSSKSSPSAVVHATRTCFDSRLELDQVLCLVQLDSNRTAIKTRYGKIYDWCFSKTLTDMSFLFAAVDGSFNENIEAWDVSHVTIMDNLFIGATSFNQPLNRWDVSSVVSMDGMFKSAIAFNQSLNGWDVSSLTSMDEMFQSATSFNQPLEGWDVSNVVSMSSLFLQATSFNQPLNAWNVSSVRKMDSTFRRASSFDHPLSDWDVSSVTTMERMFEGAAIFDQPLNDWNVSSVINAASMFFNALSFNQPLEKWNVTSLVYMENMFRDASSFNQDLCDWGFQLSKTNSIYSLSMSILM